jgi:hypothetical protein
MEYLVLQVVEDIPTNQVAQVLLDILVQGEPQEQVHLSLEVLVTVVAERILVP